MTGDYVVRIDIERLDLYSAEELDCESLVDIAAVKLAVGLQVCARDEPKEHDHVVRFFVSLENCEPGSC